MGRAYVAHKVGDVLNRDLFIIGLDMLLHFKDLLADSDLLSLLHSVK